MDTRTTTIIVIFLVYMAFILGYGLWTQKGKKHTSQDFLLAGGKVNRVHLMLHNLGTAFGGSDFFSMCYYGFVFGIAGMHWILPWFLVTIILAKFMVPRIKIMAGNDVFAMSQWFAKAWNGNKTIEVLVGIASFVMSWAFFCAQITAMGKMVSVLIGIDSRVGILIGTIVVVTYVFVGGYGATIKMDTIQSVILILGVLAIFGYAAYNISTVPASEVIRLSPEYFTIMSSMAPLTVLNMWISRGTGNGFLKPYVHQQIYAAANAETAQKGILRGNLIAFLGAVVLIGAGMLLAKVIPVASVEDPESIIPFFLKNYVNAVPAGLILAGIFAGILSSADSMLVSTVNLWTGSLVSLWDKDVLNNDERRVKVAKFSVVLWGFLGIIVVLWVPSVVTLTLRGASFVVTLVPALFATIFFRRQVDVKVVIASIGSGFISVLLFYLIPQLSAVPEGGAFPSLCIATAVMVVGALAVKKTDPVVEFPELDAYEAKRSSKGCVKAAN